MSTFLLERTFLTTEPLVICKCNFSHTHQLVECWNGYKCEMVDCVKSVQIRSFFWSVLPRVRTLNTEIYRVKLHIQSECEKIRARKNSVYGHFSRCGSLLSETLTNQKFGVFNVFLVSQLFVILWTWHFHKILRGDFIFIFFCSNKPNGVFWVSIK